MSYNTPDMSHWSYNTPNMSYCAVENTKSAMRQVVSLLEQHDSWEEWVSNMNKYERSSIRGLLKACATLLEARVLSPSAVCKTAAIIIDGKEAMGALP